MTDYTILSNIAVGVGGLPSGATITALRDNPIAIAEGAPGAPRVLDAALGTTSTAAGTAWVIKRTAGASVGAVGTYALLRFAVSKAASPGSTHAGSLLMYSSADVSSGGIPSGTWRCMGHTRGGGSIGPTLFLRIS